MTPAQRAALLVQVVRCCTELLSRQAAAGTCAAADGVPQGAAHAGEQVALLLLALQLVQSLACPRPAAADDCGGGGSSSGSGSAVGGSGSGAGVTSALLSGSSQGELEQLMADALTLLRLARTLPALRDSGVVTDAGLGAADVVGSMAAASDRTPLPHIASVLYAVAMDSCRSAAAEEVLGDAAASTSGYSLAADLLLFLACDWSSAALGMADPALAQHERAGVAKLYAAVNSRLASALAVTPGGGTCAPLDPPGALTRAA